MAFLQIFVSQQLFFLISKHLDTMSNVTDCAPSKTDLCLKVDDEESTITLSLQLYFIWMDPRLNVEIPSEDVSYTNFAI